MLTYHEPRLDIDINIPALLCSFYILSIDMNCEPNLIKNKITSLIKNIVIFLLQREIYFQDDFLQGDFIKYGTFFPILF